MHLFKLRLSTLITAVVALALLAVAMDWSTPTGVAEAVAPNTPTWDPNNPVVSGDGTMTLNWNTAPGATGYEFRYSSAAACLFHDVGCVAGETAWAPANTNTEYTTPKGTLTVGTTYWFQIRAVNNEGTIDNNEDNNDDTYSVPSELRSAIQRAAPAKLANVAAVAGNAQVTLSWAPFPPQTTSSATNTALTQTRWPAPAAGPSGKASTTSATR
jgi:hypothetical protein